MRSSAKDTVQFLRREATVRGPRVPIRQKVGGFLWTLGEAFGRVGAEFRDIGAQQKGEKHTYLADVTLYPVRKEEFANFKRFLLRNERIEQIGDHPTETPALTGILSVEAQGFPSATAAEAAVMRAVRTALQDCHLLVSRCKVVVEDTELEGPRLTK